MTNETILIVPGYQGSGSAHWQTWIEHQIPGATRVIQNWERPILGEWSYNITSAVKTANAPVWIIAHSFGCLASIVACSENPENIKGLMLVAPADPERFDFGGVKKWHGYGASESIRSSIPTKLLPSPSMVVASSNDPWMQASKASLWGGCWGSAMFTLKDAGHINTDAGFGPWPDGLKLFNHFKEQVNQVQINSTRHKDSLPPSIIQINDNESTFSCFAR